MDVGGISHSSLLQPVVQQPQKLAPSAQGNIKPTEEATESPRERAKETGKGAVIDIHA